MKSGTVGLGQFFDHGSETRLLQSVVTKCQSETGGKLQMAMKKTIRMSHTGDDPGCGTLTTIMNAKNETFRRH